MFKAKTIQRGYQFGMGKDAIDYYICVPERHWKDGGTFTAEYNGQSQTFHANEHVKELTQERHGGEYQTRYYLWAMDTGELEDTAKALFEDEPFIIDIYPGTPREAVKKLGEILKMNLGNTLVKIYIQQEKDTKIIELPYRIEVNDEVKIAVDLLT